MIVSLADLSQDDARQALEQQRAVAKSRRAAPRTGVVNLSALAGKQLPHDKASDQ